MKNFMVIFVLIILSGSLAADFAKFTADQYVDAILQNKMITKEQVVSRQDIQAVDGKVRRIILTFNQKNDPQAGVEIFSVEKESAIARIESSLKLGVSLAGKNAFVYRRQNIVVYVGGVPQVQAEKFKKILNQLK